MPGARANGLLASNAISSVPAKAERIVARNTAFHRGCPPLAPNPVSKLGLSAMMYAMVIKVDRPAMISVFTLVPFSFSLKNFST